MLQGQLPDKMPTRWATPIPTRHGHRRAVSPVSASDDSTINNPHLYLCFYCLAESAAGAAVEKPAPVSAPCRRGPEQKAQAAAAAAAAARQRQLAHESGY